MKFEHTAVTGWEAAFRGMRNPLESWDRSDSHWTDFCIEGFSKPISTNYTIGEKDMELAQRLISGGPPHSKFLRYIHVSVDITAPIYWWKEFDTYKVGTVANSTSTMHKLASTPITLDCFEIDDYNSDIIDKLNDPYLIEIKGIIGFLEELRQKYNETKDKRYWKELIRWLPESWLQTRTVDLNYEILRNIYHWRKDHKLTEWSVSFVEWVKSLPYANELILFDN